MSIKIQKISVLGERWCYMVVVEIHAIKVKTQQLSIIIRRIGVRNFRLFLFTFCSILYLYAWSQQNLIHCQAFFDRKNAILDEITFCASSIFHTSQAIFSLIWTNFCEAHCALVYLYLLHLTELTGSYRNRKETCQYLYLHIFFLHTFVVLCDRGFEFLYLCLMETAVEGQ